VIGGEILYNERMFYVQDKQDGAFSPCHPFTNTIVKIQNTLIGVPGLKTGNTGSSTKYYKNCDSDDYLLFYNCY